jgi:hypothetical protein
VPPLEWLTNKFAGSWMMHLKGLLGFSKIFPVFHPEFELEAILRYKFVGIPLE